MIKNKKINLTELIGICAAEIYHCIYHIISKVNVLSKELWEKKNAALKEAILASKVF